jgi:cholesterol transport system auxiliary component
MNPANKLKASLALLLLASLAGCGVLPKREPTAIFEPARPAAVARADLPQANWSLVVARPVAGGLLDNDRIAVRPAPGEISVYKAASWTETAPELVQDALLRRFEDSGRILSVARPGSGVRGQFQLQTDLRVFESVYVNPGRPEAQVEIFAKLVKTADGEVVAARTFRQTEAAANENLSSVVDAFGLALNRSTEQIVAWTLESGNRKQ